MLTQTQGLSSSSCCPGSEEPGVHQELMEDTVRTAGTGWPCVSYSVTQLGGKTGMGDIWSYSVCLPKCLVWLNLTFQEMAEHLGSSKLTPYCALLASTVFVLHTKLSLSQPMHFLAFTLLILIPILLGGEWVSSCVGLSCLPRLNHNTNFQNSNYPVSKKIFLKSLLTFAI